MKKLFVNCSYFILVGISILSHACVDSRAQQEVCTTDLPLEASSFLVETVEEDCTGIDSLLVEERELVSSYDTMLIGHGYDFDRNGKLKTGDRQQAIYQKDQQAILLKELMSEDLKKALKNTKKYIKKRGYHKKYQIGELKFTNQQIYDVLKALETTQNGETALSDLFDCYKIRGEDKLGNVHFTSYYTPILKVRRTPDSLFSFPLYTKPENWEGKLPTREQIDGEGILKGQGLEIAYAKNLLDIQLMQVQGSGYVEYPDGSREMFSYNGKNGYPYKSLGRHLVSTGRVSPKAISMSSIKKYFAEHPEEVDALINYNPSYTFFRPRGKDKKPSGSARVDLTAIHSIAVDKKYIPLGSILLGKVPFIDRKNNLHHYEYKILIAHDVGGAIKGTGHVDVYGGVGLKGRKFANAMHHYGNLWLLLPRDVDFSR